MEDRKSGTAPRPLRPFTVRTMEIQDLHRVYKLGEASFKADLYPMLYRSWDEYEVTTLFNTDGDYCLVAEADDETEELCGFVLGTVISKPGSAWSYGYIIWLGVHPDWQREGVASKLVDKLVEFMIEEDGIRIMMADTDPTNVRAVKFFNKKGFTDTKAHLYMSSNLENNHLYSEMVQENRDETTKKKRPRTPVRRVTDFNKKVRVLGMASKGAPVLTLIKNKKKKKKNKNSKKKK